MGKNRYLKNKNKNYKTSALILEGGSNRGIFTAGVLDYLQNEQLRFAYVIGTSAGSINAADFKAGNRGRMMSSIMHECSEDTGYFNLSAFIRSHSLMDMDKIFYDYPMRMYPFDYKSFAEDPTSIEAVATNCNTGQPDYLSFGNGSNRVNIVCRASSSVPVFSTMTELDGELYLDGGPSDAVPIYRALSLGYKRCVVILTRQKGYRKHFTKQRKLAYQVLFKNYPNLARTLSTWDKRYNKTMDFIDKHEKLGHIFVIRPTIKEVKNLENNREKLASFYVNGYNTMEERYYEMLEFLNSNTIKKR